MNVEIATQLQAAQVPPFKFSSNGTLNEKFSGKTVKSMEVSEVQAGELTPMALRLRIHFTDGSYLEVDRKATELPNNQRKVMHLNLVCQSN